MRICSAVAQASRLLVALLLPLGAFTVLPAAADTSQPDQEMRCTSVEAGVTGSVDLSLQTKGAGKEKLRARAEAGSVLHVCYSLAWNDSVSVAGEDRVDVTIIESTGNPLDATVAACAGIRIVVDGPVTGFVHLSLVADGDARTKADGLQVHPETTSELSRTIDATSNEEIISTICLASDGTASTT